MRCPLEDLETVVIAVQNSESHPMHNAAGVGPCAGPFGDAQFPELLWQEPPDSGDLAQTKRTISGSVSPLQVSNATVKFKESWK